MEKLEQLLDEGACLIFRKNVESRWQIIKAIPCGYGLFYNDDITSMGWLFQRFILENRINLAEWVVERTHAQLQLPLLAG